MTQTLTASTGKLQISERIEQKMRDGSLTSKQVDEFRDFLDHVDAELLQHRIIQHNAFSEWFQKGEASHEELRHFVQQFSVFSNQFLVAALLKVINAPSLQAMHQSKEILLNELGVIYRKRDNPSGNKNGLSEADKDREGDPELVSTEGTVDGGLFRFQAAHFEWLLKMGEQLGFTFNDLGKRRHGRPTTLRFCDALQTTYGSDDPQFAEGASFAVENWAAAGFWQQLEDGFMKLKKARYPNLKVAFFTWHNRVEAQHAGHTMEELEEAYFSPDFDRDKFLAGGRAILDPIALFWDGLEDDRINKVYS